MSQVYIKEPSTDGKVLLVTSAGEFELELWSKEAPKACRNFIQLCMEGYYDKTIFHRVVPGFIVQGGDPKGDGTGGESVYGKPFKDEIHPRLKFNRRGLVAMANAGPNDNGSQFFFTLGSSPELDKKHTIFAKVVGNTIYNLPKFEEGIIGENDRPEYPHKVIKTEILKNPFDDITPRLKIENEVVKHKEKKKGTKNFKLLSFGEEAEEEEETYKTINKTLTKENSAHDIANDPKLSGDVQDSASSLERIKEKLKKRDKKKHKEDLNEDVRSKYSKEKKYDDYEKSKTKSKHREDYLSESKSKRRDEKDRKHDKYKSDSRNMDYERHSRKYEHRKSEERDFDRKKRDRKNYSEEKSDDSETEVNRFSKKRRPERDDSDDYSRKYDKKRHRKSRKESEEREEYLNKNYGKRERDSGESEERDEHNKHKKKDRRDSRKSEKTDIDYKGHESKLQTEDKDSDENKLGRSKTTLKDKLDIINQHEEGKSGIESIKSKNREKPKSDEAHKSECKPSNSSIVQSTEIGKTLSGRDVVEKSDVNLYDGVDINSEEKKELCVSDIDSNKTNIEESKHKEPIDIDNNEISKADKDKEDATESSKEKSDSEKELRNKHTFNKKKPKYNKDDSGDDTSKVLENRGRDEKKGRSSSDSDDSGNEKDTGYAKKKERRNSESFVIENKFITEEERIEKEKKIADMRRESKKLMREITGKSRPVREKIEETDEKEAKKSKENILDADYLSEMKEYKNTKNKIGKKGSEREKKTLDLLSKFTFKLRNVREKDDEEEENSWMKHKIRFSEEEPVLAKDANMKDATWHDINDPRHSHNISKRKESEKKEKHRKR